MYPSPLGKGSGEGVRPYPEIVYYLTSKTEYFSAVFKLHLTEETRTQLQEEEAIASSCHILAIYA